MTKKQTRIAKKLFKKSLDQKRQLSANRVHQILSALKRAKPREVLGILKAYRRLIAFQIKKEEVEVETAQTIKSKKIEKLLLSKTGARRINFKINPAVVLGAKITHGDWVWDETLDAKLQELTNENYEHS